MKEYELVVLVHPDLEIDLEKPLDKVRKIITTNGGEITKEDNWGKKRLSYRINREDFAVYVYFELKLPAPAPQKISNALNITDEILRYLLTAVDVKAREAAAAAAEKEKENDKEEKADESTEEA